MPGSSSPHVPTPGQLTQLGVLQATQTSANATLISAQATLATAQAAKIAADKAVVEYRHYIYGGTPARAPNTLDEGNQNQT